jgi:type VI secretion system secreted protein Hcp
MPIYMQFPGANGSVTARNFQGWIELSSVSFGMDRPTDSRLGTVGYAATGKLQIHNITISKQTDRASPTLTIAALQGAFNQTVKIAFTTTSSSGMVNFLSYELQQCGISSAHTSGGSDGMPVETYALSFSQIQFTFNNMDESGQSQPTITGYDLATGQSL